MGIGSLLYPLKTLENLKTSIYHFLTELFGHHVIGRCGS